MGEPRAWKKVSQGPLRIPASVDLDTAPRWGAQEKPQEQRLPRGAEWPPGCSRPLGTLFSRTMISGLSSSSLIDSTKVGDISD